MPHSHISPAVCGQAQAPLLFPAPCPYHKLPTRSLQNFRKTTQACPLSGHGQPLPHCSPQGYVPWQHCTLLFAAWATTARLTNPHFHCHLLYLWNSDLNSTASITLHYSGGREYCPSCPLGPPFQITGPALHLNFVHVHAAPTLHPVLAKVGREMKTIHWKGERRYFWSHCTCVQSSLASLCWLLQAHLPGLRSSGALSVTLALLLPLTTNGSHSH